VELKNKIKLIRTKKGLTQSALAQAMGYSDTNLSHMERGTRNISSAVLDAFRKAVGLPGVPITPKEVTHFKELLFSWKDNLDRNELDKAKERQPELARNAEWSYEPELLTYYNIFSAGYYRKIKDTDAHKKIMDLLREKVHCFDNEQSYWYYRQVGIDKLSAWRYKEALVAYFKADKLAKHLHLDNTSLYYHIAYCLTDMGYAYHANDYLEMMLTRTHKKSINTYYVQIQSYLASNISYFGKADEALAMLNDCIREEESKKNAAESIGALYRRIALVHRLMGNFNEAIKNLDVATKYYEANSDSQGYLLYHKALVLFEANQVSDGMKHLNSALSLIKECTLWDLLATSLKHSRSLDNKSSLKYIERITIPKLFEYGRYRELLMYYNILCSHYEAINNYKQSLAYIRLAHNTANELTQGVMINEKTV